MFEINKSYNFQTLAPSILGVSYNNLKVMGIVNAKEASKEADIVTKHTSVKQVLSGIPDNVNDMVYVIFTNSDNDTIVLAINYIDPTTVVLVTTINLKIEIFDISSDMEVIVKQRLKELGINTFNINTFTV